MTRKVYILDAGAIFSGIPLLSYNACYTTLEVVKEVLDVDSREKLDLSLQLEKLVIIEPKDEWWREAVKKAREAGTLKKLSKADLSLLSLALQFRDEGLEPVVLSDDYTLQYTLKSIGLKYSPIKTVGIDKKGTRVE